MICASNQIVKDLHDQPIAFSCDHGRRPRNLRLRVLSQLPGFASFEANAYGKKGPHSKISELIKRTTRKAVNRFIRWPGRSLLPILTQRYSHCCHILALESSSKQDSVFTQANMLRPQTKSRSPFGDFSKLPNPRGPRKGNE